MPSSISPPRRSGFSLIELLIASVAASVLALTAGTMLVYAWMSWRDVQEGIEMQRDASLALSWMRNRVWAAGDDEVTVSGNALYIQTESGLSGIFQRNADLVYDSDLADEGGEQIIVEGRVQPNSFIPRIVTRAGRDLVEVEFSLVGDIGHERTTFRTAMALRN